MAVSTKTYAWALEQVRFSKNEVRENNRFSRWAEVVLEAKCAGKTSITWAECNALTGDKYGQNAADKARAWSFRLGKARKVMLEVFADVRSDSESKSITWA